MKEFRELIEAKELKILGEKKTKDGDVMNVSVPWIQADKKNQNKRIYPKSLLQREIARVQASVKKGAFLGTGDHPAHGLADIATASHIVTALSLDEKGQGWAEFRILPTNRGKNIQTLIRNGATLGVSCRGFGNIGQDGTVLDDYKLVGVDIVTSPSFKDATFSQKNVFESLSFEEQQQQDDGDTLADREEALYDLLHTSYDKAIIDGLWYGDFESYKELHEKGLRATLLLPEKDGKTSVQKLTEEAVKERIYGYYLEAVKGGYIGAFDKWKEEFPQLVEQASKSIKISEKKAPESKEPFKSEATWEEIQLSGFKGTMEEYEKQCPDITIIRPKPIQKPISETIEQEAERIFSALKRETPNSSVTLGSVKRMLEKEAIVKSDKRLRKRAIAIVSRDLDGSVSQEKLEKMVEQEIKNLKEERQEMRERNWQAYKRLLD